MVSTTASQQRVTSEEEKCSSIELLVNTKDDDVFASQEGNKTVESTNYEDVSNGTTTNCRSRSLQEVATQMSTKVDFFRNHAPDIAGLLTFPYTILPTYCQEIDGDTETTRFELRKRLIRDVTHFPLLPKKGKLQVPMALFCEAEDDPQKTLVIINYWRQLRACKQRELKTSMQRFYVRPNVTNERLNLVTKDSASPPRKVSKQISEKQRGRSRSYIAPWGFRCLETCTHLAERLGLCGPDENPKHACELLRTANLEFPRMSCKAEDCTYPALARNHGYCCRHGLHFGPTPGRVNGRRGYLLLGDVYTRPYLAPTSSNTNSQSQKNNSASNTTAHIKKLTTCSCRNETCIGIGYSPTMIQFDIRRFPEELREAIWSNPDALNMTAKTYFQTSRNKSNDENDAMRSSILRLAPWHFHPEHREFLPDGSWKLLDSFRPTSTNGTTYEDDASTTLKKWNGLPLPTYSTKKFLEEPIMKEYVARKATIASTTDMLPSWCREYGKLEEGPSSISEVQKNFLWDHSIELEKTLASKLVSFRTKERAMETELERLRGKYNEKKFLKRRDKKRKRTNNISNLKTKGTKNNNANTNTSKAKTSSSGALQEHNTINNNNQAKKIRSKHMNKSAQNLSDYDGRTDKGVESNNASERRGSASAMESNHRRDSLRMGSMHYTNHPRQQQQQHHHQHPHHPYPHSYPPHPRHLPHHTTHPNRTAPINHQHHHQHHPQQQRQQQQQQQPQSGSYPQHHQAYHHTRRNERADQYPEHPQEHPPEVPEQQQEHQEQQRPQHYPEQQDWQRGFYN